MSSLYNYVLKNQINTKTAINVDTNVPPLLQLYHKKLVQFEIIFFSGNYISVIHYIIQHDRLDKTKRFSLTIIAHSRYVSCHDTLVYIESQIIP